MRSILGFFFYFIFFGLFFIALQVYFPDTFNTLVGVGVKTFNFLRDAIMVVVEKIQGAVKS